jgi:hypothetical protein
MQIDWIKVYSFEKPDGWVEGTNDGEDVQEDVPEDVPEDNTEDTNITFPDYVRYMNVIDVDDAAKTITTKFGGAESGQY